jgi:hypothetical protein
MHRSQTQRLAGAIAFAALLLFPCPGRAQECGSGDETPAATLSWIGITDAGSSTTGSTTALSVRNAGRAPADILVSVHADFGTPRGKSKKFRLRDVAPGSSQNVIIDLERLRPPAEMAFAAQLLAVAEVRAAGQCDDGACRALRSNPAQTVDADADGTRAPGAAAPVAEDVGADLVVAAPIYFHRTATPGTFEIYGSDVLTSRHAGGDLGGRMPLLDEPDTVVQRVGDAGKGLTATASRLGEQAIGSLPTDFIPSPPDTDPAPADGYRLCVRWEVQVTEQGRKVDLGNGTVITEDYWHGYPKPAGNGFLAGGVPSNTGKMVVTARGPRVLVKKDGWSHTATAHPATGCFSFTAPVEGPFTLFVFGEHHDVHGNTTIVRNRDGMQLAWSKTIDPPKGKTRLVAVGNYDSNATLAAISGFAMYRSAMGVTGKTIDLRPVNTCASKGGNNSSAHHRFDGLEDGIAYVRLSDGTGVGSSDGEPCTTSDHRRAKFIVTHEMGHAWMLLRTKSAEPNVDLNLESANETVCGTGSGYTPTSLEYAAVGAREGMAHFYASIVWNDTASANGVFSMFGTGRSLETFSTEKGGRLWNSCTSTIKCGSSVIMDWALFWWDVHTPYGPGKPSLAKIAAIYERAIETGGLTRDNYYEKFEAAMHAEIADANVRQAFENFADWNGIATSPSGPHCIAPYTYPDCSSNPPENGAGNPGCPCTDVLDLSPNNAHEADIDGYHGDGQGSYTETGSAQYCLDGGSDTVVCGLVKNGPSSIYAPVCQVCGEDTMIGCPCTNEDQCNNGLDTELLGCHGAPADGWGGSDPGVCLPSASSVQGRERLVDMPWFCLENCGSKGSNYTCLYDQLEPSIGNDHARCVEAVACDPPAGYCESGGAMCSVETSCAFDWDQCCVAECTTDVDCEMLNFPGFYQCSAGSCVPSECNGSFSEYCSLYR